MTELGGFTRSVHYAFMLYLKTKSKYALVEKSRES
jgi:hypothetical protein